jgi:hypothetical protein
MALGRKTGGRVKGRSANRAAEVRDELKLFAIRVQRAIEASDNTESLERLTCRLMTNPKNPAIAAGMIQKWVEWRYGKATDNIKIEQTIQMSVQDADGIIGQYLTTPGQYLTITPIGAHTASQGDTGEASKQAEHLLPGDGTVQ